MKLNPNPDKWLRDGNLVYELEEYRDDRGRTDVRNRWWAAVYCKSASTEEAEAIAELVRDAAELLDICRELAWAIDRRHGRECSDATRREMEPVAARARAMLEKHGEPPFPR